MNIDERLKKLEARIIPAWSPVLTVPHAPGENWDEAVKKALAAAPEPPRGCAYRLVVPAPAATGDEWEAYAKAEMAAYYANNESNNIGE